MTVRRAVTAIAAVVAAVAALPSAAVGGGWATVGVDPLPGGARAGTPWRAELTILQHGRTPLEDVRPAVVIRPAGGGRERSFAAGTTGRPGVYAARVVFPARGTWSYAVDDGFGARHAFADVRVGDAPSRTAADTAPSADDEGGLRWPWRVLLAAGAGLAAALLVNRLRRGRWAPAG